MRSEKNIESLSDYIQKIEKIRNSFGDNDVIVYRGENQEFKNPCMPNLFRKDYTTKNHFFEKNLLDDMVANKLTEGESYLIKAVDAQHGGFPSRLLDVTYSSLVALYFAITPFYTWPEDQDDDKNGVVYIFDFEKIYCPIAKNVKELYNNILDRKEKWLFKDTLFQYNHKFVDHILANNRIIAQQGAVILFQGDEFVPIPEYCYEKVIIPYNLKSVFRKELKDLFGIYTGFIYPEGDHKVDEIIDKSIKFDSSFFSKKTELKLISDHIKKYFGYNIKRIVAQKEQISSFELERQIMTIEREIRELKKRILDLSEITDDEKEVYDKLKEEFNKQIDSLEKNIKIVNNKMIISSDELKL